MSRFLYFVRKFVPALVMPFGLSLLLIAIGIVRRRRGPALAGLILLIAAGTPVISNSLCLILENQYPRIAADRCPPADVIVALSGFAGENPRFPGEIRWYYSVDRFEQAVHLFKLQKAPLLLFTRTQSPEDDKPNITADLVRRAAIEDGVPADAVRITRPVATTADEAVAVRDFLSANGGQRVILVTSAMHMGRAALLFRRAGIDFTPFPVDYAADGWAWQWERFVPSPAPLDQTERCLHEIYGDLFYDVFFRAK